MREGAWLPWPCGGGVNFQGWGPGKPCPSGFLGALHSAARWPPPTSSPSSFVPSRAASSRHSCARLQGPTNQTQEHTRLVYGGRLCPGRGPAGWGHRQEAANSFHQLRDGNKRGAGNCFTVGREREAVRRTPRGEACMCFENNNRPSWGGETCMGVLFCFHSL